MVEDEKQRIIEDRESETEGEEYEFSFLSQTVQYTVQFIYK